MTAKRLSLLAVLPFALLACEAEEEPVVDETAVVATDLEPVPPPTPATTPGAAAGAITIDMQPLNNSGVMGEATVSEAAAGTEVMVRLTSAPAGEHAGHIHQGTCASPGSVVVALQPVTTGADGTGMMTTTVDPAFSTVANGQHLIAYHEAGGTPGTPVVCGEIPTR